MSNTILASSYIPTTEEKNFKLMLRETDRGISLYELDRTIRIDITIIGELLVKRLKHESFILNNFTPNQNKVYLLIARGCKSNFNSVPQLFRWLVSPVQPALIISSLVHDWATSEFDDSGFHVFTYNGDYYISRDTDVDENSIAQLDLRALIGQYHKYTILGKTYIKWSESAEVYRNLAKDYKGRTSKVTTFLAFNAIRLAGFFKRALGNTK